MAEKNAPIVPPQGPMAVAAQEVSSLQPCKP
jgi:hypothetical protein